MAFYTEVKRINISHRPHPKGVLLRWLNPLNNWECWLFAGKKQKQLTSEGTISFRDADYRNNKVARREGYESLTLRTFIPGKEQIKGLATLFTSPLVHAVIAGKEYPCTVSEGSQTLLDEAVKHGSMQVEIQLQRINSLTQ